MEYILVILQIVKQDSGWGGGVKESGTKGKHYSIGKQKRKLLREIFKKILFRKQC
jgi:hypothetical protein